MPTLTEPRLCQCANQCGLPLPNGIKAGKQRYLVGHSPYGNYSNKSEQRALVVTTQGSKPDVCSKCGSDFIVTEPLDGDIRTVAYKCFLCAKYYF